MLFSITVCQIEQEVNIVDDSDRVKMPTVLHFQREHSSVHFAVDFIVGKNIPLCFFVPYY